MILQQGHDGIQKLSQKEFITNLVMINKKAAKSLFDKLYKQGVQYVSVTIHNHYNLISMVNQDMEKHNVKIVSDELVSGSEINQYLEGES